MSSSPHLSRSLGLKLAIVIVIGNIIGSGVYKKVAPMAAELHAPGWVLVCWVLGGVITLFGALSNAELAGMLADTGGEYAYYKKIYGRFFAYLYGWSDFAAIKTAAIASLAYVFAQSLNHIIHLPLILTSLADVNIGGIFYPFANFNEKLLSIILILLLTYLNTTGLKTGAGFSTFLLLLMLGGILLIVFFGLSSSSANISSAFSFETPAEHPITMSTIFTAMLAAFWGYEGWNSVGFLGGEIKNPHRNIPLSIVLGLVLVIAVYFFANLAYLSLLPISSLEQVNAQGSSIAAVEAVKVFWGNGGQLFMSLLIVISTLGCTHATIMSSARTYYAMAVEKLFFKKTGTLNKAHVPAGALWYQGVWGCILILSGTFDQITDMLIFAAFIYYGATTVGVFILRKKMPDAPRPYKTWGYPVIPAIFILFCVILIFNTIVERPREAGIGMALILAGVPLYWWFGKKSTG
ncbi:MAG: amino acid permease [Chitinophagaceae bacterium]|nr:amino acid permease [Chitinophagaceae bacterium]